MNNIRVDAIDPYILIVGVDGVRLTNIILMNNIRVDAIHPYIPIVGVDGVHPAKHPPKPYRQLSFPSHCDNIATNIAHIYFIVKKDWS